MRKLHKILSVILALLMVISIIPITVNAAEISGTCGTNATWTYNDTTGTLYISGTGETTKYKLSDNRPWSDFVTEVKTIIIEDGITKIGNYSFYGFTNLTKVSIPESVISLGTNLFRGCQKLTSIALPNNITAISSNLFIGCSSLENIVIPNRVNTISYDAFSGCSSLESITLPDDVYYVYDSAFKNCTSLTTVIFGKNIYQIENNAFSGCTGLTTVYYTGSKDQWNGVLIGTNNTPLTSAQIYYDSISVDDGTGHIHNYKLTITKPTCVEDGNASYACECGDTITENFPALGHVEQKLPEVLPTTTTTGLTAGIKCSRCNEILVKQIVIPAVGENITDNGIEGELYWAFDEFSGVLHIYGAGPMKDYQQDKNRGWNGFVDKIKTVIMHEGITTVGQRAFNACVNLENVSIPSTVTSIGAASFYDCRKLGSITIPENVTTIDVNAFYGCDALTSVVIPDSVNTIHESAFRYCENLADITLPDKAISIEQYAFSGTAYLKDESNLENGNLYIGKHLIKATDDNLVDGNVTIKDGTLTIADYAGAGNNGFRNIVIPDSVVIIGKQAFYSCENLRRVTIGKGVTKIGEEAFNYSDRLTSITVDSENKYYMSDEYNVLYDKAQTTLINYPVWNMQTSIEIPDSVTTICEGAFSTYEFLTDIYYHGTKEQWSNIAKTDSGLYSEYSDYYVTIHYVMESDEYKYVVLSETEKAIAIIGCKSSNIGPTLEIPSTIDGYRVTKLGDGAFIKDNYLESITIPTTVTTIGNSAFPKCVSLSDVYYNGTNEQWNQITIGSDNNNIINAKKHFKVNDTENDDTGVGVTYSGACGPDISWILNSHTGKLVISGTGPMYDYEYNSGTQTVNYPWNKYEPSIKDLIKTVVIEDGVTTIGDNVFYYCQNLYSVVIPDSVTSIGICAFDACYALKNIEIPESVTTIKDSAFAFSGLETVILPNSITTISEGLFSNCESLINVTIPDSVTTIEDSAFSYCYSLRVMTVPKNVTSMGISVFYECKNLVRVDFLCNITTIGSGTFENCKKLDELVIPQSVTSFGWYAFYNCKNIRDVYYGGTEEQWDKITFEGIMLSNPFNNAIIHYTNCEHVYTSEITTPATHLNEGIATYTCTCGSTYTETIERIPDHAYESVVTAPTCTEQGFTTYICECNETYVTDYVDALGHTKKEYENDIIAPTCTEEGSKKVVTCCIVCEKCFDTKTVSVPALGHTPANAVEENYVAPTCTADGSKDVVVYCSVCDEEISRDAVTIDATGHADNDGNGYCDMDNELLDPSVQCDHNCHKGGISGFFWKIANFFNKLFGLKQYCECGEAHY